MVEFVIQNHHFDDPIHGNLQKAFGPKHHVCCVSIFAASLTMKNEILRDLRQSDSGTVIYSNSQTYNERVQQIGIPYNYTAEQTVFPSPHKSHSVVYSFDNIMSVHFLVERQKIVL